MAGEKMAEPSVFGIGYPKSGGHSLAKALERIGFGKVIHVGHETFHRGRGLVESVTRNKDRGLKVFSGIDCDAVVDWPVCDWFDVLMNQYREAKFVMSFRPPQDAAISWVRMVASQPGRHTNPRNYSEFEAYAKSHVDKVFGAFSGMPERLLFLDMRDDDETKWKLLCQFVGADVPADPFPSEFGHKDWQVNA